MSEPYVRIKRADRDRSKTTLTCGPSRTKQSFKQEADINYIVERWGSVNLGAQNQTRPMYGDFTQVTDFHGAQNQMLQAQEGFATLGARLRERFNNDPGALLDFVDNPENLEEAQALGILPKPAPASAAAIIVPTNTPTVEPTVDEPADPPAD